MRGGVTSPAEAVTMDNGNYNVVNTSMASDGGSPEGDAGQYQRDHQLEAYTVVLSVAAHLLSMLFGGSSAMAVVVAIMSRSNIDKLSYALVLTLFFSTLGLNAAWSPLEVLDILLYHYNYRHPSTEFVAIKLSLYIFLVIIVSLTVALLSTEAVLRMKNCFGRLLRRLWPLLSCLVAVFISAFLTAVLISMCVEPGSIVEDSYLVTGSQIRTVVLGLLSFVMGVSVIALVILVVIITKDCVYWEDGRPHVRQKKLKLTIPEFLISQSNTCAGADNDGAYDGSNCGTPSPSTPKLLTVCTPDDMSGKGEQVPLPELPSHAPKPMSNRLGINMAQVLGRRRHTICQISDSSTSAHVPPDPITKAKEYNYVRKFSVDISALQAQLQNPKMFKEAPFQSDVDLARKQAAENANPKPPPPKPLLPLVALPLKFEEKDEKQDEDKTTTKEKEAISLFPPPPVIKVSNDDAQSTHDEEENDDEDDVKNGATNDVRLLKEAIQDAQDPPPAPIRSAQKPTSLAFKEPVPEDPISAPTLESTFTEPSETESEGQKVARLTVLLLLTFILTMLPVFVTEMLRHALSRHAYTNIHTCTLAVSAIQTIAYPHLIAGADHVIHRAVHRLRRRIASACGCRSEQDTSSQIEENSSTSQV